MSRVRRLPLASFLSRLVCLILCLFILYPPVISAADPYSASDINSINNNTPFYDPSACSGVDSSSGSGSSGSIGAPITGNLQSLGQQIMNNANITFDFGPNGPTGTQFKRIAAGQKAQTDAGRKVDVEPIILVVILFMAQNHKVNISALTDGSSHTAPTNPHGSGKAVDINIFDGSHTTGTDSVADAITKAAAPVLPKGSRFGLGKNGNVALGSTQIDGKNFITFQDNPTHVHIDVLNVSQSADNAAVQAANLGEATNTSTGDSTCCASSGDGSSPTLSGDTNGVKAYNYFVSRGLSPAGAAGIVGNLTEESIGVNPQQPQTGFYGYAGSVSVPYQKLPPGALDKPKFGWGVAQFTPPNSFIKPAKGKGASDSQLNSLAYQIQWIWNLMKDNPSYYMLPQLKAANTPEQAADIFLQGYERGSPNPSREAYARAYYNLATKQTPLPKSVPVFSGDGGSGSGASTTSSTGCANEPSSQGTNNCNVTAPVWGSVNGSGNEYSQQQLASIFGDPGTASSHSAMDAHLTTVDFLGNSVKVNKKAADCLKAVAQEIQTKNVNYKIKEMGCYRFDSNNGSSNIGLKSYHTYGVACDINWDDNPFVASGAPTAHDMPQAYIQAFHDHGWTWGGNWHAPKDYMHFEFNGVKP